MTTATRSSNKSKDDESSSSKKTTVISKGSSTSGSATTDTSSLRRSTREIPSRKQISSSPSNTRKSERLEKTIPSTTPVNGHSKIVDKQRMPSPSRNSDGGKKHQSSSSSGSKKSEKGSGSLDVKRKTMKTKSLKQFTPAAPETSRREEQHSKSAGMKIKTMDARTYKSFFKPRQKRDTAPEIDEELERPDKLSQVDSSCCGAGVSKQAEDGEGDGAGECSERMAEELREEPHSPSETDGLDASKSCQGVEETRDDIERVEVDCSAVVKLQAPELVCSSCIGRTLDGDIDEGSGGRLASKRKRCTVELVCKASATLASKRVCISNVHAVSPLSYGCERDSLVGTCLTCSKRRRVDYDSPVQELCVCDVSLNKDQQYAAFIPKDRVELEANVHVFVDKSDCTTQGKESPLDVQSDGHHNICVICELGGKLRCCDGKGCQRRYHLTCLDPPLDDVPLKDWHCLLCTKKKIESGVYSVSEGLQSVWDAREVDIQDIEGSRKQKQFFVKYKGLAHIHNHWIPETRLLLEAPLLVSKFNQDNQVIMWREQWRVPHRLLKKRLLRSPKQQDCKHSEHTGEFSDCQYEWLVKWCDLDYEDATWELENASFLCSSQAQRLIEEYENRRQRAKAASFSQVDKNKKGSSVKIPKLPAGVLPGNDSNQLSSVNKLREYWHKGQNAVVIDDQERVTKVILFILTLVSDVSLPILIISNSSSLSLWEVQFSCFAPSIDFVVYSGNKDARRFIRTYEFYEEGGCMMFQVLLSTIEALVEDIEMLKCLGWEVIIVDECQHTGISRHIEQIKMLASEVRVLLFNGQLQDSIAEHRNLLLLLDSPSDLESIDGPRNDHLGNLRDRLSRFIAYECKSDSSRFLEYWVPVMISNVQLEQYCYTLLSNSMSLRSCSKNHHLGALQDILVSARKCCDHPYIVDPHLQGFLTKDLPATEYLDVGIKASCKLQLLDTMLSEIRNQGLRVVVLFQSIRGSGTSIGDILEDFLLQRFGPDSYERVDDGLPPQKKQAALSKFNDTASGMFVFLLENRACHSRIKLSSVDTVVIFDSDWNPANDLKALHKLSIDSSSELIKIFRLYSSCTVDEKVLVLATHDATLNSNLTSLSRSTSTMHLLLMWGASYLFSKLDEFHAGAVLSSGPDISFEPSLFKDVRKEFVALLSQDGENTYTNNSLITKVQHGGGTYSKNGSLFGELKIQLTDGEEHREFWTKLFEGRFPRWRYICGPSQRNRKRVQYLGDVAKKPEVEADEVGRKRKKVVNSSADLASLRPRLKEVELSGNKSGGLGVTTGSGSELLPSSTAFVTSALHSNHTSTPPFPSNHIPLVPEAYITESGDGKGMHDLQKSLHVLLKPEILKLCEILQLPEDLKLMVGRFLEYIINNHHVSRESATLLQAFQISLCWIAASFLKYKIDRKETLSIARQHLSYGCTEDEADNVYSKLRSVRKKFLHSIENSQESETSKDSVPANSKESETTKDSVPAAEDLMKGLSDARMPRSVAYRKQTVKVEVEERSEQEQHAEEQRSSELQQASKHKLEKGIAEGTKHIQKKYQKGLTKLIRKQQEETHDFSRIWEEKRVLQEKRHMLDSAVVCSIHGNTPVGLDKLKRLDDEFAKKMEEHKRQKEIHLKDLQANQLAKRGKERQNAARWLEQTVSLVHAEPSTVLPSNGWEFGGMSEHRVHDGRENIAIVSGCCLVESSRVAPSDIPSTAACEVVECGVANETLALPLSLNHETVAGDSLELHRVSVAGFEHVDAPVNDMFADRLPSAQILDGASSSAQVPESVSNELVSGDDSVEIVKNPGVESNGEYSQTQRDDLDMAVLDSITSQEDEAGCSINGNSPSVGMPLVNTPVVQPAVAPALARVSPRNSDAGSQPSASAGIPDTNVPGSENRNVLQQDGVDAGPTNQTSHVTLVNEHSQQVHLFPCDDSPVDQNQLNLSSASGDEQLPNSLGGTDSVNVDNPKQFENPAEPSNQAVLEPGVNLATPLPVQLTDVSVCQNQPDLHLAVRNNHQPGSEVCTSSQNAEASQELVEDAARLLNPVVPGTQLGINLPIGTHDGVGTHLRLHNAYQATTSQMQTLHADPLRNELERLLKETELAVKDHEDTKLRLKSDCEKEIEEIIAKIRRKFTAKLQVAEAAFLVKKNELDTNHKNVLMNMILAEAFRTKCLDFRSSGTIGMQQVASSSSMQNLHLLSSQPGPRLSPVTGSPVFSDAASQQVTASPLVVNHSSGLFSRMPTRPPQIVPTNPPTGNSEVVSAVRALAPHLQPFRPPSSMSATSTASLLQGLASQHMPVSLPTTLPLLPPAPTRAPPPPPPPPIHHSGHYDRSPSLEVTKGFLNREKSAQPMLGSTCDVKNLPAANPPDMLPPLNFSVLEASHLGSPCLRGIGRVNLARSDVAADIVCLSDDD